MRFQESGFMLILFERHDTLSGSFHTFHGVRGDTVPGIGLMVHVRLLCNLSIQLQIQDTSSLASQVVFFNGFLYDKICWKATGEAMWKLQARIAPWQSKAPPARMRERRPGQTFTSKIQQTSLPKINKANLCPTRLMSKGNQFVCNSYLFQLISNQSICWKLCSCQIHAFFSDWLAD